MHYLTRSRTITISAYEQQLARARAAQPIPPASPNTKPPAESGTQDQSPDAPPPRERRARVRGISKVAADFSLLTAASTYPASVRSYCTKPLSLSGKSLRHDSKNTAAQQIPHRSRYLGLTSRHANRPNPSQTDTSRHITSNLERIAAAGLSGSVLVPWRQVTVFRAARPAATPRSLQDWCASR